MPLMVPSWGGIYELCSHICSGETTDGSKEDLMAHLKLPEFPKDDDKRVPPTYFCFLPIVIIILNGELPRSRDQIHKRGRVPSL